MSEASDVQVRDDGKYSIDGCETWFNPTSKGVEVLCHALLTARATIAELRGNVAELTRMEAKAGRERDARVTVEDVSAWLHEWLYFKNGIENKALEDAIRHIDDDQAGIAAAYTRPAPEVDGGGDGKGGGE